ncbi:shikimate kinase [Galactobacter valiniphilus]|nr:shikimate kinase [Galactobacter valiniphilus]
MKKTVVLVGPMGSGKSSVGRELSRALNLPFVDLDEELVSRHGPIPALFAARGEAAFRELESAALAAVLAGPAVVLATGGGAVLAEANRAALAEHTVIRLTISPETAARRLAGDATRPLLAGDHPEEAWARIARERAPHYQAVASHTVAADADGPQTVARTVLTAMRTEPEEHSS